MSQCLFLLAQLPFEFLDPFLVVKTRRFHLLRLRTIPVIGLFTGNTPPCKLLRLQFPLPTVGR